MPTRELARVHETSADLIEEQKMAEVIRQKWNCDLKKLPKNYHIDYAIMRGDEVVGFIEMRRRYMTSDKHPDTFVSLKKWMGISSIARQQKVPAFFAVQYDDKLCITPVDDRLLKMGVNGNSARGYEDSFEPVVHIPKEQFKTVEESSVCHPTFAEREYANRWRPQIPDRRMR